MAKNLDDLRKSREFRENLLLKMGVIPESILRHDKTVKAIDLIADVRSYKSASNVKDGTKHSAIFDVSGQGCSQGALSRFSQNIAKIMLLIFTDEGDNIVDPFAGHNSRMEVCWRNNRNYLGQDLCHEFMEANRKISAMLAEEASGDMFSSAHSTAWIKLYEGDSRKLPFEDASGDFTITSPPYWDIEYYGPESEQLGTNRTYAQFIEGLQQVANENFRCLKRGAFCIWFVNDFRKDGVFYSYHEDTANCLRKAGFIQHDMLIIDLGASIRASFATQIMQNRILPKRHEYGLIFRKQ